MLGGTGQNYQTEPAPIYRNIFFSCIEMLLPYTIQRFYHFVLSTMYYYKLTGRPQTLELQPSSRRIICIVLGHEMSPDWLIDHVDRVQHDNYSTSHIQCVSTGYNHSPYGILGLITLGFSSVQSILDVSAGIHCRKPLI
jgi:hypothetical protein